ncbi:hypothetical protein PVAND_000483 [Polypedilum vanderplanki]|uniref:Trafficking kinesin-binding protein milt n=1 Tax=Polypedilum vanderplanki TaxID=319348 RepID=A0A9J6BK91_POLVA|nr:hypothetical protein PVAND_000483 [Polypedilum vanderplanki]
MTQSDADLIKKYQSICRELEDKEKDLVLSAKIGKELLEKNSKLEDKIYDLETELKAANENIEQLSYQLSQKNDLINVLTSDECGSENVTPTSSKSINAELMFRKIATLEEENKSLRSEIHEVVAQTDEIEEQERRIMEDLNNQLSNTNQQLDSLTFELERYKEENRLQYEEIVSLTKRCQEAEMRLHQLTTENDETTSMLCITKENQDLLAQELAEFKVRYAETHALLLETQEMLKKYVKKAQPSARSSLIPGGFTNHFNTSFSYINDSLQSELLDSLDSGILSDLGNASKTYKAVNDTMRFVQNSTKDSKSSTDVMSQLDSTSAIMSSSISQYRMSSYAQPPPYNDNTGFYSTIYGAPVNVKAPAEVEQENSNRKMGDMGTPGAKDLEEALKRLTPAEILSRRAMLSYSPAGTYSYDEPPMCRTPESIMSTLSSISTNNRWQMPKKLEIVKPLEGSMTLNQWKGLATPTFGGLLQENVHVKVRGEKKLEDLGLQMYSLSDLEEDPEDNPGKQFIYSPCIYTYTNSTVMHPDDGTSSITFSLPPSQVSSRMQSTVASRQPTAPPTPRNLSRRNSCSTFSVNFGLASVLNERGIKAVTPSCLNTPTGQNFSPTVTPCNSPESTSPIRPSSPEPGPSSSTLKNKSAQLLHLEKKALRSLKLLEKVEQFGLDNVMATTPSCRISPLALYSSNIYTHRSSPMAQLTSLKHLTEKRNSDENLKAHLASNELKSPTEGTSSSTGSSKFENPKKNHSERIKNHRIQRTRSRRNILTNGMGQQRQDLGTVHIRPDLGKVERAEGEKSIVGEFVGTISSLLFGRKGGFL